MAYHPFRNLGLKAFAVGLATLLWLTVLGEHVVERGVRAPLEFRNIPETLEIMGEPPAAVDVRVRGTSGLLSRLQPGEVVAVLDLASARPGSRLFHLRTDQVQAPYGVEVAQVAPATVAIELERSGERTVPVVPSIEGAPAPGFDVGTVSVTPPEVAVIGPVSRLEALTQATTETVSIEGADSTVKDLVTIGVMDSALRLKAPQSAMVEVEIVPAPVERDLADVPVHLRNLRERLRAEVTPAAVVVSVRGGPERLAGLGPDGVTAFVDLAGLGPGRYNLPVRVDQPTDFGVSGIAPATVAVRIR